MILMIENFYDCFGYQEEIKKRLKEEKKSDWGDEDDDNFKAYTSMTTKKTLRERPPLPFLLITGFFKTYPEFYRLEGLFDVAFEENEFKLFKVHLKFMKFPIKYRDPFFLVNYLRHLLEQQKTPILPLEEFNSLSGLPEWIQVIRMNLLVKKFNPRQKNTIRHCLDFLWNIVSYQS